MPTSTPRSSTDPTPEERPPMSQRSDSQPESSGEGSAPERGRDTAHDADDDRSIPTGASLHGTISTIPRLTVIGTEPARFYAEVDVTTAPVGHEARPSIRCGLVIVGAAAQRAYQTLRQGDPVVASGQLDSYEYDREGLVTEFVAEQVGPDVTHPNCTVNRRSARRAAAPTLVPRVTAPRPESPQPGL
ncbi:MAG: hypothetical protein QM572_11940 [Nocardioides sp.]|uniref:single-stranded DNA-binding protein n=1 Tax=Nocardioides sp. TaxID=35761 RepID=UPI0039E2351C